MLQIKPLLLVPAPTPRNPSQLATTLGLSPDTPDNVVRHVAGAMKSNTDAHTIKTEYDANNPPPPPEATQKGILKKPKE